MITVNVQENTNSRSRKKREATETGMSASLNVQLSSEESLYINPYDYEEITYHSINITASSSSIIIQIVPKNQSIIYKLFLGFDEYPNTTYFNASDQLPKKLKYETFFYGEDFENGTYKLGIKQCKFILSVRRQCF